MSFYVFPPLATSLTALFLAFLVFNRNRRSPSNFIFTLMCLEFFIWQACWFASYFLATDPQRQMIAKIAFSTIVFLPVTALHFVTHFLDRWRSRDGEVVRLLYAFSGLFFLLLWSTNLIVDGYRIFSWGQYAKAGPLHPLLVLFVVAALGRLLWMLTTAVTRRSGERTATQHNQTKFTWIAFVLFCCSAVEFLINYGVNFYPIGAFFILASFSVIFYAITRYRLMDISLAIRRTTVFMLVYTLALGLPLLGALAWEAQLQRAIGSRWWVGLVITYALLATAAHYANQYFQKRAEDRLLGEEHKAHGDLRFISQDMMRFLRESTLLKQIARRLVSVLNITHAAIYLTEGQDGRYRQKASRYHPPQKDSSLPDALAATSTLAKDLATVRIPRVKEELRLHQQALSANWREMAREMDLFKASVMIPAFHQRRFLGFLVLGDKRSGRIWTQDDLNLLMVLANQAALAIENARFHEAEEQKVVERERDQMALDISGAVSHQYSNRIQVIENLCWQAMSWLEQVLKKGEFDLTKLTRVLRAFESIRKECARAGEIAKGVMSLAKTIPAEFQPAEIPPMVRDAIEFVIFKHARGKVVEETEIPEIVNGIPPNLPKISCNSAQVHDSIMNVIDNAVDAIEDRIRKMRLKVLPEPPEPYHGRVVVKAQEENGKVIITVEDNGIGIKEPDKKKIFVPLFTTKGSSQGMGPGGHGLGLFYIKRILMAHGGRISVESEYGKGTCCTIHLPALKEDKASHAA